MMNHAAEAVRLNERSKVKLEQSIGPIARAEAQILATQALVHATLAAARLREVPADA